MKPYQILTMDAQPTTALVVAISHEDPIDAMIMIESELAASSVQGSVTFDFLGSTGTGSERFATMDFDGTHFQCSTFRFAPETGDTVVPSMTASLFTSGDFNLDDTILTTATKNLLRHGVIL